MKPCIGGKERNKHEHKKQPAGRDTIGKQAVVGMRERSGRTRAKPIADTSRKTLQTEVAGSVEFDSTVYTDHHPACARLSMACNRESVCHSASEYVNGMAHTNGIESVWAVLKRGIYGIYHHVSGKHLHRYVDEAAFRPNEYNVNIPLMSRIASLCGMTAGKTLPYEQLVGG